MNKEDIQRLIEMFSEKTGCAAQYNGCSCNTCHHAISDDVDFKHICWLMLLIIRGDADEKETGEILDMIEEELSIYNEDFDYDEAPEEEIAKPLSIIIEEALGEEPMTEETQRIIINKAVMDWGERVKLEEEAEE